jgi:hypothetical protein
VHRTRTVCSNERSVASLRQKFGINQGPEERIAYVALETPEPLRLGRSQSKTRHFDEFALNSLEHLIHTHGSVPPINPTSTFGVR